MKKIILKINPQTNIIEDIGESYTFVPVDYMEVELETYPNDIMSACYKWQSGEIVKDEHLYSQFLQTIATLESRLNA